MTLFLDGQGHYTTPFIGEKWILDPTDATFAIVAEGRTANCIKRTATGGGQNAGRLTKTPLFHQTGTWTPQSGGAFGCALEVDDPTRAVGMTQPTVSDIYGGVIVIYSGAQTVLAVQLNPDGTFSLFRFRQVVSGGSILLQNSVGGLDPAVYSYLQFKWVLSATNGLFQILQDGNLILSYVGRTMPNAGEMFPFPVPPATWTSAAVFGMRSDASPPFLTARMCDVYLIDLVPPNGDFLGDVTIDYIKPNGGGAETSWSPSAGANWQCVDEVPPNDDTDYVQTSIIGARDTYNFEDVIGDPTAIQVCSYVRKTGAGAASLSAITRQGGVDYDGPAQGLAGTDYAYLLQPYDTNPSTSAQWTKAQMDAGEWGPLKAL